MSSFAHYPLYGGQHTFRNVMVQLLQLILYLPFSPSCPLPLILSAPWHRRKHWRHFNGIKHSSPHHKYLFSKQINTVTVCFWPELIIEVIESSRKGFEFAAAWKWGFHKQFKRIKMIGNIWKKADLSSAEHWWSLHPNMTESHAHMSTEEVHISTTRCSQHKTSSAHVAQAKPSLILMLSPWAYEEVNYL